MSNDSDRDKLARAQQVAEAFRDVLEEGDIVAKICGEEILQYACDVLSSVDAEYTPENVMGVLMVVATLAHHNAEGWSKYTKEIAPMVVAGIRTTGRVPLNTDDQTRH